MSVERPRTRTAPSGVSVMGRPADGMLAWFLDGVAWRLEARGHPVRRQKGHDGASIPPDVRVVLNAVDPQRPQSFRRRSKDIFVVGVAELPERPADMLQAGYTLLVRSLSNAFIPIARNGGRPEAFFITMEQGFHEFDHAGDEEAFFGEVLE
ncbi:MAG: class II aldolase/adducin family protein, partial [Candidatus Limnocylindria bacterium]